MHNRCLLIYTCLQIDTHGVPPPSLLTRSPRQAGSRDPRAAYSNIRYANTGRFSVSVDISRLQYYINKGLTIILKLRYLVDMNKVEVCDRAAAGEYQCCLAREYGVSRQRIWFIIHKGRKYWAARVGVRGRPYKGLVED